MHICAPAEDVALPVGTEGEICVTGPNIMQAIRARAVAVVWCALPCLVMAASCQPTADTWCIRHAMLAMPRCACWGVVRIVRERASL